MIETAGAYDLPHDIYHSDPCIVPSLSRSTIKELINRSAAHAWFNHPRLNPAFQADDGGGKFDVGTSSHSLILEGIDNVAIIEADDWRTKAAKELREKARGEGKTPLLPHQFGEVKKCVLRVMEQICGCVELGIKNLMEDGDPELSFFWKEEETWLRSRLDWISADRKLILDLKFTEMSVNPADLSRYILNMGLDIQNVLYCRAVEAVFGIKPKFVFVFAEVNEPYICSFVGLPPDFLALGQSKVEYGIYLWRECMKSGNWPAYPNRIAYVDLPGWAMAAWESKSSEIGVGK